jgi:predicted amidohydrolase
MIIDPWGRILASAGGTGEAVVVADIDVADVPAARSKIPNLKNSRDFELAAAPPPAVSQGVGG